MKKLVLIGAAAAALLAVPGVAQAPQRAQAQPLTLAAMQTRVQAQFARSDADGDGFLTQAEIQALAVTRPTREQRLANREQRQERRARRLARLDTNRDGTISEAEHPARGVDQAQREARQAQRLERRAQRRDVNGARGLRINEQRFARLDADGDNRLSLAEVTARLATRFERLDANRDGGISREERRSAREQRQARRAG